MKGWHFMKKSPPLWARLRSRQKMPAVNVVSQAAYYVLPCRSWPRRCWSCPDLPEFHARYPELKLELFTDDCFADLVLDNFDAGIRMQRMLQKDMVAVPIDQGQQHVIVASPGYLAQHGQPETPQELQQHDCMRYRFPGSGKLEPWYFSNGTEQLALEVNGRLIFNENQLLKDAAIAGLGLSQRFRAAVHQELQSGQLREVLQDFSNVAPGFFIYFPAGRHMPLKLRAFIDFMRENASGRSSRSALELLGIERLGGCESRAKVFHFFVFSVASECGSLMTLLTKYPV